MIKQIDDELYHLTSKWLEARETPPFPKDFLTNRGYFCFIDEKPVMCGFLYKDESAAFGMIEWILSNPDSTKEERAVAFSELMDHIAVVGKEIGIKYLFTTSNVQNLTDKYISKNFIIQETAVTHLFKEI